MKRLLWLFVGLAVLLTSEDAQAFEPTATSEMVTVVPAEYPDALRNPMKGFRPDVGRHAFGREFATIARCYIRWSEIENGENDGVEKILAFCDRKWVDVESHNIKVIPRVYLDWDAKPGNEYWPADMTAWDYDSEQFRSRLTRLIARLGECWDNDPRVAWVQMGLIGYWGEHHHPAPSPEMQKLLGEAFASAFKNKRVLVRHAHEFTDFKVGIYWDSWAHIQQTTRPEHGAGIEALNNATGRWKHCPIEGETAYNWGDYKIQPGDGPNDTLADPAHREFLVDTIRRLHCTGLGWISGYNPHDPVVRAGADEVQKAFGYRFVIRSFSCARRAEPNGTLRFALTVVNTGSAPFYEDWPVELSLLDPLTNKPVWKCELENVDIRTWLPGDDWDDAKNIYNTPPTTNAVWQCLRLPGPERLPKGEYIAALSILEPVGRQPNVLFAVRNYCSGGRHPFCKVGIGVDVGGDYALDPETFDDPMKDKRLPYSLHPTP